MMVSCIILAGGKGSRFQKTGHEWIDKLRARINGKPMIKWVFERVEPISDEVIISTNTEERGKIYYKILSSEKVRVIVDKFIGCRGPLLGIASSANYVRGDAVITIPADMPFIETESIRKLVSLLGKNDVVVPMWQDGMTENLLTVTNAGYLKNVSNFLCSKKYWSPSGVIRAASRAYFVDVSKIFSDAKELVNINYYVDLHEIKPRRQLLRGNDTIIERYLPNLSKELSDEVLLNILEKSDNVFLLGVLYFFLSLSKNEEAALKSAKAFEMEARMYLKKGIYGLAALAYQDAGRTLKQIGHWVVAEQYFEKSDEILKLLNTEPKRRFI